MSVPSSRRHPELSRFHSVVPGRDPSCTSAAGKPSAPTTRLAEPTGIGIVSGAAQPPLPRTV
jgi:hypothetical protein